MVKIPPPLFSDMFHIRKMDYFLNSKCIKRIKKLCTI